jgi:hypothetical protein
VTGLQKPGRSSSLLFPTSVHRRRFAQLLGTAALGPFWACRTATEDREALAHLLGLQPPELTWLERLSPAEQRELRATLERPTADRTDRAVNVIFSMMGTRSRTFAFAGYPAVEDRRSVCDGLLAE